MTDEQLDEIDGVVGWPRAAQKVFCERPHKDVDLFNEALRAAGFESYADLEPWKARKKHECSLWLRRPDHRCVPELYALAVLKFGELKSRRPYWKDGSPSNNAIENIELTEPLSRNLFQTKSQNPTWNDPVGRAVHREEAKLGARKRKAAFIEARETLPISLLEAVTKDYTPPNQKYLEDDDRDPNSVDAYLARAYKEIEDRKKEEAKKLREAQEQELQEASSRKENASSRKENEPPES